MAWPIPKTPAQHKSTPHGLPWALWLTVVILSCGGCGGSAAYRSSIPPQQARFTIVLGHYRQSDHRQAAAAFLERAGTVLPTEELWLERHADETLVNYGYFNTAGAHSAIERQLHYLKSIAARIEPDPYQFFYIRPLEIPDPPMPSSWKLTSASCDYTLEIASFYDDPEHDYYSRKADALTFLRALRQEHSHAWLLHGTYESRVYIGCISKSEFTKGPDGQRDINSSATVRNLLAAFRFRYENGMEVYTVSTNDAGQRRRLPIMPSLVRLRDIKRGITF